MDGMAIKLETALSRYNEFRYTEKEKKQTITLQWNKFVTKNLWLYL